MLFRIGDESCTTASNAGGSRELLVLIDLDFEHRTAAAAAPLDDTVDRIAPRFELTEILFHVRKLGPLPPSSARVDGHCAPAPFPERYGP
jgi:hypothetical protein